MSNIKYRKLYFLFMLLEILLLIMISGCIIFRKKDGDDKTYIFRNVYKFPKYFTDINLKVIIACFYYVFSYSDSIIYEN